MAELAIVKDSHLSFNGRSYFRGGSEDIEIGCYGEKKSPITKTNYLEIQDRIPVPKLKIREAAEIKIDFTKTSEKDLLANINVPLVFKGSVNTAYEDLREDRLKLVKLTINNEDLKDAANQSPKVVENLIEYGNDARLVDDVFVVLSAESAKSFAAGASFDVTASVEGVKITANGNGGSSGSTTVTVSKGMCLAYGLVKLDWDASMKKNKTEITKVTDDQWGLS